MTPDDELSAAAKSLHREWESPDLWPAIEAEIVASERASASTTWSRPRQWVAWGAAAAVVVLAATATLVLMRPWLTRDTTRTPSVASDALLSDEALTDVERAEQQYIAAIEALAIKASPVVNAPKTPLEAQLRERLLVIDAAIGDCRAEIERNRFNAHLRRQLLWIYQEKRQTLEQILELEQQNVS